MATDSQSDSDWDRNYAVDAAVEATASPADADINEDFSFREDVSPASDADWEETYSREAASQSFQEQESSPALLSKKARRPEGSFGSRDLRRRMASMENMPPEQGNRAFQPGTIEYAFRLRMQKHQAANEARRIDVAQGHRIDSTRKSVVDSLKPFGQVAVMNRAGTDLQQDLLQAIAKCSDQKMEQRDELVQHALDDAMSNVSVRALEKLLGESHIADRMLSIATACLELCCCFWAIMLGTLRSLLCWIGRTLPVL